MHNIYNNVFSLPHLLISLSRWLTHCLFHIPLLIRLAMLVFTRILFHFAHSIATQSGFYAWKHYRWLSLQIWPNIFGNYVGMPQKRNYVDYCKLALLVMKWKKKLNNSNFESEICFQQDHGQRIHVHRIVIRSIFFLSFCLPLWGFGFSLFFSIFFILT